MTTIAPTAMALLLAKIAKVDYVSWDLYEHDTYSLAVDDVLVPLMDHGLVTVHDSIRNSAVVVVTKAGHDIAGHASPALLCGEQTNGEDRASAALWFYLLIHGAVLGSYGSDDKFGRRGEIAHLLICGLDIKASSPVRDDVWEEWAGTFHDGHRVTGVSGRATCRCGAVAGLTVNHEVESVTALVRAALGF